MSMEFLRQLPSPDEIKEQYPISLAALSCKQACDEEIRRIFTESPRKRCC